MDATNTGVTFVLTSCNRFDLLEPTLMSFLKYNTYPIEKFIIIEDSPYIDKLNKVLNRVLNKFKDIHFTVLFNNPQIGQLPSIDRAYSYVNTKYIFHCEDDWVFYRPQFIEKSLSVLNENDSIITVWLREQSDTNGHPIEPEIYQSKAGDQYKLLSTGYMDLFHGFTFNPGLRRIKDYELIRPFSKWEEEGDLSKVYNEYKFRGAILLDGYVKHIGDHRKIRFILNQKQWVRNIIYFRKLLVSSILKFIKTIFK